MSHSDVPIFLLVANENLERLLAQNEKPGKIVRNRLEQAGYDPSDTLGEQVSRDLSTYLKFVYKSVVLGPPVRSFIILLRHNVIIITSFLTFPA